MHYRGSLDTSIYYKDLDPLGHVAKPSLVTFKYIAITPGKLRVTS
jgi:acyl-CoA thioesterase FadM